VLSSSLDKITAAYLEEQLPAAEGSPPSAPSPPPPVTGEMTLPAQMTVKDLAAVLSGDPFHIIADLAEVGVFATANQLLEFETMSKVVRKYGFRARKAD
jgi:hypothetical protein